MQNHVLKTAAPFWDAIARNVKLFEVRFNDRGFRTGDTLELHRLPGVDEDPNATPPAPLMRRITYIMPGGMDFGGRQLVDAGAVIMSIAPINAASGRSLDRAVAVHLAETLTEVRGKIDAVAMALESCASMPITAMAARQIIKMIDEALEEGGPGS